MGREPFFLQWHLTDACNQRCAHCYRDAPQADLPEAALTAILDQFQAFLRRRWLPGRVHFTGGEPLLRPDRLLSLMRAARERALRTRLLTNGTLLKPALACDLAAAGCEAVQISLEGPREVHDQVRGEGSFEAALAGAGHARRAGLSTTLSIAVARWNRVHLPAVASLAREHFDRLFVHRFVPWGHGAPLVGEALSAAEWRQVARWCLRTSASRAGPPIPFRDPTFACLRPRPPAEGPLVGGCAVGYTGFAVEANGDVYPCRRLPVVIGNLLHDDLEEIWRGEALEQLRNRDALTDRCGRCELRWHCGGCRAVAYALGGSALAEDPQCPLRRR
jgi:radical SAM protein with 4Fe4S-binding SPASM domain